MIPERVSVSKLLFMLILGKFEPVPPPVNVCGPVPEMLIVALPVAPTELWVISPLASMVPVLMLQLFVEPFNDSVALTVKVVPEAMV